MERKAHAISDSEDSEEGNQYVPLSRRLGATGTSVADAISVDSSSDEGEGAVEQTQVNHRKNGERMFSTRQTPSKRSPPSQSRSSPPPLSPASPPHPGSPLSLSSAPSPRSSPSHAPRFGHSVSPMSSSSSPLPSPAPSPRRSPSPSPRRSPAPPAPPQSSAPVGAGAGVGVVGPRAARGTGVAAAAAEAKRQRQLDREEAKRRKELDRRLKQAEAAAKRTIRPENCQKSLHALVDPRLLELDGGGHVLAALQATDVTVHVTCQPQPCTVSWQRDVTGHREADGQIVTATARETENQLVVVYAAADVASLIQHQLAGESPGLVGAMRELGLKTGKKVTVLCWGLDQFCRTKTMAGSYHQAEAGKTGGSKRRKGAPKLDRFEMESVLVDAMLETEHNVRFVSTPEEGGQFLVQMCKAIAETPFKRQRDEQHFSWFADAEAAHPVKVDRQLRGLRRLWCQQLRQLPGGSLESAQAISAAYPSPQALVQAYDACSSENECKALVADLPIRRTFGPLVTSRRIGPEMSRKLYLIMSTTDGSTAI